MDCNLKFFYRGVLLVLLLPLLIWGYGKSVLRMAQSANDSAIDGSLTGGQSSDTASGNSSGTASGKPGKRILELKVSAPLDAGNSPGDGGVQDGTVANGSQSTAGVDSPGKSGSAGDSGSRAQDSLRAESGNPTSAIERQPAKIEPELADPTYIQIRAKKPSIPDRFDGTSAERLETGSGQSPVSFLGVLGVPTLVFSLLFFVMWGIISGRIQRIMF